MGFSASSGKAVSIIRQFWPGDRKSTRPELQSRGHLVCRLLLEKKKEPASAAGGEPRRDREGLRPQSPADDRAHYPRGQAALSLFFFNATATTEIYTLSLHDALPISSRSCSPTLRCSPCSPIHRSRS